VTKALIGGAVAVLVVLAFAGGFRARQRHAQPHVPPSATSTAATAAPGQAHPGFLYGRVTTVGGATQEGRLRWGGDQEAFWGDYFNGYKDENPWARLVPPQRLPRERRQVKIFGIEIADREEPADLGRFFMARFGDIARIEAARRDVRVTLKSGTVFDLDRFEAGDFDDGVRVWDATRGVVDFDSLVIRAIEFLSSGRKDAAPDRLHGTVRTRQGDFTGFVQWDREECVGSDTLDGRTDEGEVSLRFDTVRSIARRSPDSSLVTLLDGREWVLSGTRAVGEGHRGVYVDDARYGRVLVSWHAFERVDFSPAGGGPGYDEYPPGRPLAGRVTTRAGQRLAGRLVFDLDESETTETLDAPSQGVDYTIPFGLIAAIEPHVAERARVTLRDGEVLQLERSGDLGGRNAGLLVFVNGRERPEYVPWRDVERIDLDASSGGTFPALDLAEQEGHAPERVGAIAHGAPAGGDGVLADDVGGRELVAQRLAVLVAGEPDRIEEEVHGPADHEHEAQDQAEDAGPLSAVIDDARADQPVPERPVA
jgi:hypothetical protein